jgi:hypothetical protein
MPASASPVFVMILTGHSPSVRAGILNVTDVEVALTISQSTLFTVMMFDPAVLVKPEPVTVTSVR